MSVHAMIAAAYVENLDPSTRLVLMAVADSSDEHTLEAAPGLPKLRAWSGLSKRQTLRVVKALEDAGYLRKVLAAHRGRRAVWQVFPGGVPAIPHPTEVAARYADEDVVPNVETDSTVVDNLDGKGVTGDTQTDGMGVMGSRMGVMAMTPLQSYPSVSLGDDSAKTPVPRVDKAAPRPSTASGFPGARSRTTANEDGTPKAHTPNLGPECPTHPGHHHPCPMCARNRVPTEDAADVIAEARKALRRNRTTATATTTEEKRPA